MKKNILLLLFTLLLCVAFFDTLLWLKNALIYTDQLIAIVIILLVVMALLFKKYFVDQSVFKNTPNATPVYVFLLVVLCSVGTHARLALPQIDMALFFIATYGLGGIFLQNTSWWKRGLPIAVLLAVCIPFVVEFGSGFGFFLRIASSQVVEFILRGVGVNVMSSHDILIFENGISQVDTPCSGLKSLLTGTMFFLLAAFIKKRTITLQSCLQYAVFCGVLFSTNVVRVLVLVVLYEVFNWHETAEMMHVPLGIATFSFSCIVGWGLLTCSYQQKICPEPKVCSQESDASILSFRTISLFLVVFLSLAVAIVSKSSSPKFIAALSNADTVLLAKLKAVPLSFSKVETNFFSAKKNTRAFKWNFVTDDVAGEILLVTSSSLNGIHSPEICFMGNGMAIDSINSRTIAGIHCTVISFKNSPKRAVYWLQQGESTTQSFLTRFWEHVVLGKMRWSMKAVLLDTQERLDSESVKQVLYSLHQLQKI